GIGIGSDAPPEPSVSIGTVIAGSVSSVQPVIPIGERSSGRGAMPNAKAASNPMSANAGWFARGEHVGARGTRVAYDRVQLRVAAHGGVGVGDDDRLGGETGRQSRDGCESRDHGNTRTRCGRTWENRSRPFLPLRSSADTTAADGGPGSACAERDTDRERGHEAAVARRVED